MERLTYEIRNGKAMWGGRTLEDWASLAVARVVDEFAHPSARPGCRLLAGEMPDDIEDVFAAVGLSLFPARADELSMDCTCPDGRCRASTWPPCSTCWPSRSTTDPFGILAWRGRDRDTLLDGIPELLGESARSIENQPRQALQYYRSIDHAVEVFRSYFGPTIRAAEAVGPEGEPRLREDPAAVFARDNRATEGTAVVENTYLLTIATVS